MTPRLARAYRRTAYRIAEVEFHVGRRCPPMDALLRHRGVRTAAFITAHNPFSHRMPNEWNVRMQARLVERLRRRQTLPGTGSLRQWHEDHILVFGPVAPTIRLARIMRQNGIVILRLGQSVDLVATS